jgi:hypothetical protein
LKLKVFKYFSLPRKIRRKSLCETDIPRQKFVFEGVPRHSTPGVEGGKIRVPPIYKGGEKKKKKNDFAGYLFFGRYH